MNAPSREKLINWLKKDTDDQTCKILTNVRCLSEGVDIPALDAVLFLSDRNSQIDVVQSVGRVMRVATGKKYGYIIIPIIIPSNVAPEKALDNNDQYKVIWSVLNALRSHDDRFNATINKLDLNKSRPENILVGGVAPIDDGDGTQGVISERIRQMQFEFMNELQNVIYAKIVQKVGDRDYWLDWAKEVADIAGREIESITEAVKHGPVKTAFVDFLTEIRGSVDKEITEDRAIEMLAQHAITAPVFDALFENYKFTDKSLFKIS